MFDVPAGAIAGGINDLWQRPITDVGQTGPDKGAGGKFLILGPGDKDLPSPPDGYYVFRSPTKTSGPACAPSIADQAKARALAERLTIYPYAQRDKPPARKHMRPEGRKWTGEQPRGIAYWELLARVIGEEPAHERDRIILAMLVPLGIEKGKPFKPDERQRAILSRSRERRRADGPRQQLRQAFSGSAVWPGTKWEYSLFLTETNQEAPNYTQLDERSSWFYEAAGVSIGMMGRTVGAGQVYLEAQKNSTGAWLDGGSTTRCTCRRTRPSRSSGRSRFTTTRAVA